MTTAEDRLFDRFKADKILEHRARNGVKYLNHFAEKLPPEESFYRGILTEIEFAKQFGLPMDDNVYSYGDGGRDFTIDLMVGDVIRPFVVNVKTKSVRKSISGLIKSGTHLRVCVQEARKFTIYIFGTYLVPSDSAQVHRWSWGKTLIEANVQKTFEHSNQQPCYTLPFEQCRPLHELKSRCPKYLQHIHPLPPPFSSPRIIRN